MKTTIEIADDLFEQVQQLARREKTTFRSLTEQGLRMVLKKKWAGHKKLPPIVTVRGNGMTEGSTDDHWNRIRDDIHRGHGA